jgi:putative PIN family toxin of toxin-antitoxin system
MLICSQIDDEVVRTMTKKFRHDPHEVQDLLSFYTHEATRIFVPGKLTGICRDPKDDFVLECAVLGEADVIVSGDKDLLSLQTYNSIHILTPRQYLDFTFPTAPQ